jgi:hypothetical protein
MTELYHHGVMMRISIGPLLEVIRLSILFAPVIVQQPAQAADATNFAPTSIPPGSFLALESM